MSEAVSDFERPRTEKQGESDVVQQVGAPLVLSQRRDCGETPWVCDLKQAVEGKTKTER